MSAHYSQASLSFKHNLEIELQNHGHNKQKSEKSIRIGATANDSKVFQRKFFTNKFTSVINELPFKVSVSWGWHCAQQLSCHLQFWFPVSTPCCALAVALLLQLPIQGLGRQHPRGRRGQSSWLLASAQWSLYCCSLGRNEPAGGRLHFHALTLPRSLSFSL